MKVKKGTGNGERGTGAFLGGIARGFLAVAVTALGFAAVAAPSVTVNSVTENGTWSKVDVKYTLSDVDASASYKVAFDVTADGATAGVTNDAAKLESKAYTKTIDTKDLFGLAKRDAKAKVKVSLIPGFTPDVPVPDAVQLWADGPYFATFNVGASAPEEYGYYFWWGDTVGYRRSGSSWVSVKDGTTTISFSSSDATAKQTYQKDAATLKSLGFIGDDANPVLNAAHDAARAHLGAPWRMMTKAELDKLVDTSYCTRTWVTSYKGKSVSGYVVNGAKDPYKNNEVFFPAAGYGNGSSLRNSSSGGNYWFSTPNSSSYRAWSLAFGSSDFYAHDGYRYSGVSVRPVR